MDLRANSYGGRVLISGTPLANSFPLRHFNETNAIFYDRNHAPGGSGPESRATEPPMAQCEQSHSRLFELPQELRIEIYKLVLPQCRYGQTPGSSEVYKELVPAEPDHVWREGSLQLLRVCKQVNQEATHVFWTTNTFQMIVDSRKPRLCILYRDKKNADKKKPSKSTKKVRSKDMQQKVRMIRNLAVVVPLHFKQVLLHRRWAHGDCVCIPCERGDALFVMPPDLLLRPVVITPAQYYALLNASRAQLKANYELRDADTFSMRLYKRNVLYGFTRFLSLLDLDRADGRFKFFELGFHSYVDRLGNMVGSSKALRNGMLDRVPEGLMMDGWDVRVREFVPF